jgi:hypothetical protein
MGDVGGRTVTGYYYKKRIAAKNTENGTVVRLPCYIFIVLLELVVAVLLCPHWHTYKK